MTVLQPVYDAIEQYKSIRFIIVGVVATLCHAIVTVALVELTGVKLASVANTAGTITGMTISYLGNRSWTFRASGSHVQHLPKYLVSYGFVTLLNGLIMYVISDLAGIFYVYPMIALFFLSPVLTFFLNREFIFRNSS